MPARIRFACDVLSHRDSRCEADLLFAEDSLRTKLAQESLRRRSHELRGDFDARYFGDDPIRRDWFAVWTGIYSRHSIFHDRKRQVEVRGCFNEPNASLQIKFDDFCFESRFVRTMDEIEPERDIAERALQPVD